MAEPQEDAVAGEQSGAADRAGDALRSAVERTLAATAGSAAETRLRVRELLDEVARRGQEARGEVARRGEEAGERLAGAIADLNLGDRDALAPIGERIGALERRLGDLERILRRDRAGAGDSDESDPQPEGEDRGETGEGTDPDA